MEELQNMQPVEAETNGNRIIEKMYYEQGSERAQIQFTLACRNVPKGAKVGFACSVPGPNPPIYLAPTQVITYPLFTVGIVCEVPANFVGEIVAYADLMQPIPPDAKISLQAAYPVTP